MNKNTYKYFAFISYSSKDIEWGKRLQRKLELFKLPAAICNKHGWKRNPINPVFFAPSDIQPGDLNEELQERLTSSRHLIVICSPNSASSEWVGKEIEYFHKLGRTKQILFLIIDGIPNSNNPSERCFNPIIEELELPEILAANINEKIYRSKWLNRERAYIQVISKLLEIEFDTIWKRHRRALLNKILSWIIGICLMTTLLFGIWANTKPVDIDVRLTEMTSKNIMLPPLENAIITIVLNNETKKDTIKGIGTHTIFHNIPQRFIGKEVKFKFLANNFIGLDTSIILKEKISLNISRDSLIFGNINFRLYDIENDEPVCNKCVYIDSIKTISDTRGYINLYIPLKLQKTEYQITSDIPLDKSHIRMPCNSNTVVAIKKE